MPSPKNVAIIAAAGARKTQTIIEAAHAAPEERILVTTYTVENLRQLERRLAAHAGGVIPANISLITWYSLLLRDGVRPYQTEVFGEANFVRGLNFVGKQPMYAAIVNPRQFFVDHGADVYRDHLAHLACRANELSGGRVIVRIEASYDHIYVDEVQDLVGYDLEILHLLFKSSVPVTIVGDPRQHTFGTNVGTKNKKYRGPGFMKWLAERADVCTLVERHESHRCNQAICDFASALFPSMPALTSANAEVTEHHGVFYISTSEVSEYYERWKPQVLRYSKTEKALGLPAMNFGVSKGSTFDRVLIFPTGPMKRYLKDRDPAPLKEPEKFYVAVTRAKHSVAFVAK